MHCENPQCVTLAALSGAEPGTVYRRDDGIVLIDPEKAVGHKELLSTCPYRVIFWNEEKKLPQKCTFCAHLLDRGWREPRCVEACPTRALVFGDLDDPASEVTRLVAGGDTAPLRTEYNMGEKVTYTGLPKRFVAGTVVFGDSDACGEGAEITLRELGKAEARSVVGEARADNYGDFEFEGLAPDTIYVLTVTAPGYESQGLTARTHRDAYVGEIVLRPAEPRTPLSGEVR
jgi:NAD-dependent dihydropyrimidine dehydrogenase PreA subunit